MGIKFKTFCILLLICVYAHASDELQNMLDFHLSQAQLKIDNNQPAYAWGDYAYILCYVPNHHEVLEKMIKLAKELNKQQEMHKFLLRAQKEFPDDDDITKLIEIYNN